MEILCLVVVGLFVLGGVIALFLEVLGDIFEGILDLIGPIGGLILGLIVLGLCCGAISSRF